MIREPGVAGLFYPSDYSELKSVIEGFGTSSTSVQDGVIGIVAPHAGYIYSGQCAADAYKRVVVPENVIVLGVDHRGESEGVTIDGHDMWRSPLGDISVNKDIAEELIRLNSLFSMSTQYGKREHSIEVQIPLIQYYGKESRVVPVLIATHDIKILESCGRTLREVADKYNALIVASTDMSHFISADKAGEIDSYAIRAIEKCDPLELLKSVWKHRITMCGVSSVAMLLYGVGEACGEVVKYTHSGVVTGDYSSVVAYLSATISRKTGDVT